MRLGGALYPNFLPRPDPPCDRVGLAFRVHPSRPKVPCAMEEHRCPECGSTSLAADPDDHWRRICKDCGAASRFQHTLFVGVGDEHFPLPSPDAKTAAEKIKNAVGAEADSSITAFNDAELHQIGLALTRLQVSDGISQLGANLRDAILRHTLR